MPGKDLAIQGLAIFGLGQDEAAPGSPQGLVGGGGDKVRHRYGIGVETRSRSSPAMWAMSTMR